VLHDLYRRVSLQIQANSSVLKSELSCMIGGMKTSVSNLYSRRPAESSVAPQHEPKIHSPVLRVTAILLTVFIVSASQVYYAYNATSLTYDASVLVFGVLAPLLAGCALLLATDQPVVLLSFLGFFWSVVDDGPIFFDSVLTWPQVTGSHPYLPHLSLEIILHVLTLVFLLASIWLSLKHSRTKGRRAYLAYSLALLAFLISYGQNTPLSWIQAFVERSWYLLDVLERLGSLVVFSIALFESRSSSR
jgi:hypothetical protein